jgi:hypothetical protein
MAERGSVWLPARPRQAGEPQPGRQLRRAIRASGRDAESGRHGFRQISFSGLFGTVGDPTSFVSRDDRSYEVGKNVMYGRRNRRVKFGGYLFHPEFNPVDPTN